MQKTWQFKKKEKVETWADFVATVLENRNLTAAEIEEKVEARALVKKITPEKVGIAVKDCDKVYKYLERARDKNEDVVIFGDYDVDGNCATAIMWQGLKEIGLVAVPFIPHRLRHGYGIRISALKEIMETKKPDLIITVDNGITAKEALEYCQKEEVKVIVTDHHLRDESVNKTKFPALAVIQTTQLCGAGVAWLMIKELWKKMNVSNWEEKTVELLDLVCLATIADQVPLTNYNRQLAIVGLKQLRQTKRAGLRELMGISRLEREKLDADSVGFCLGPKINAIGRLTNTLEALRLLCTNSQKKAQELAQVLTLVNSKRQELTTEMLDLALRQIDEKNLDKIIWVESEKFHEGIVGLIASKLVEMYARPAIVASLEKKIGKASCRSIEGINITEVLRTFREQLIDVGGHEMAAGFSFQRENDRKVRQCLKQAAEMITDEQLQPKIEVEMTTTIEVLNKAELAQFLAQVGPFGSGNPEIVVATEGQIINWRYLGTENQHLRIDLMDDKGNYLTALFWQFANIGLKEPKEVKSIKIVGTIKTDEYKGKVKAKMIGKDWLAIK